ncbi:MAG: hypothetical protein L0H93_18510, partial [Nocardioides sp.]|nr:hypothetical protein [Nocardioides sp.]
MPGRLLVIGLDRYLMRACDRIGIDAVVVCSHKSWDAGSALAPDSVEVLRAESQRAPEAILGRLARAGLHRFDGVVTTDEQAVVAAHLVGQALGIANADPAS